MTDEQIAKLFDVYTRFNAQANRATIGTGLGMSITKHLLDMMGGEITVESHLGKGTVFTVRLPQKRMDTTTCGSEVTEQMQILRMQRASKLQKSQIIHEYMPYGSVLIVDDVSSNLFVAKGLMLPYGLKIDIVDSGFEAIELIKNGNVYDIIFMDHMMPKMDGIEAANIIRGMGYNHPIVALTANAVTGQEEMFMKIGFDGFVSKPIDTRLLNATLNNLIRDKQPPEVIARARREKSQKQMSSLDIDPFQDADPVMVRLCLEDVEEAVGTLEKLIDSDGTVDMVAYITAMHGMKSALINMGQIKLSDIAKRLEKAGLDKDMTTISFETSKFLTTLRNVIVKYKQ
jgi:CheY-like chemotaxis protein